MAVQVEAHILHQYAEDFYGKELKVLVIGFIRPEMGFSSLDELISRIQTDIGIASAQLDQLDADSLAKKGWWV
jgi:riboflavin kinase